jgi:hypothetical protein
MEAIKLLVLSPVLRLEQLFQGLQAWCTSRLGKPDSFADRNRFCHLQRSKCEELSWRARIFFTRPPDGGGDRMAWRFLNSLHIRAANSWDESHWELVIPKSLGAQSFGGPNTKVCG